MKPNFLVKEPEILVLTFHHGTLQIRNESKYNYQNDCQYLVTDRHRKKKKIVFIITFIFVNPYIFIDIKVVLDRYVHLF